MCADFMASLAECSISCTKSELFGIIVLLKAKDDNCERLRELIDKQGLRNVEARRIDIQKDLEKLGTFDCVTLLFVIHRLTEWRSVIEHLPGLIAPGGSLYVSEFVGPSGVIYLSNECGGQSQDPVSRMIRRYFELLPELYDPALKSTSIRPVREALARTLSSSGHRDFFWSQRLTAGDMYRKIETKAYAPYFSIPPSEELLRTLRREFENEWSKEVHLTETIRVYRYVNPGAPGVPQ